MRRTLLWGPPVLWMALIFHESSLSDPVPAVTDIVWDKALHLGAYALLALLLARALSGENWCWTRAAVAAAILASLYGASDEIHQLFTPMRQADVLDWVADTAGAAAGALAYGVARRLNTL